MINKTQSQETFAQRSAKNKHFAELGCATSTAVSRNDESRDLSEMGKVIN